jgi:hypothetical protein
MFYEQLNAKSSFESCAQSVAKEQIIIFTSDALIVHQHLKDLMPFFDEKNIKPVIFLLPDTQSPRAQIPSLQRYSYYEQDIVNDLIYPAIESKKVESLTVTFNQLMAHHSCQPQKVKNLKDPAIMHAINAPNTIGALSIYHDAIFKPDIINAVKEKGFFWNLHPAILPQGQGLHVLFWSLLNDHARHGYTLHEIDEGIDTGKIISKSEGDADPEKPILETYLDYISEGSDLIKAGLTEYLETGKVAFLPETEEPHAYYSFPTEEDIAKGIRKNVRLWGSVDEMLDIYSRIFGDDKNLMKIIKSDIKRVEGVSHKTRQLEPA